MPAPLRIKSNIASVGVVVALYRLARESKTMLPTSVEAEKERLVVSEAPNVATLEGPFGTVDGVQFAAVFQSPEAGLVFHLALPAKASLPAEIMARQTAGVEREVFTRKLRCGRNLREDDGTT